jgi:hypothetical protein
MVGLCPAVTDMNVGPAQPDGGEYVSGMATCMAMEQQAVASISDAETRRSVLVCGTAGGPSVRACLMNTVQPL